MILSARIDFVKHRPGVGERKDGKQDKTTWRSLVNDNATGPIRGGCRVPTAPRAPLDTPHGVVCPARKSAAVAARPRHRSVRCAQKHGLAFTNVPDSDLRTMNSSCTVESDKFDTESSPSLNATNACPSSAAISCRNVSARCQHISLYNRERTVSKSASELTIQRSSIGI